jgi:hypothetical protein
MMELEHVLHRDHDILGRTLVFQESRTGEQRIACQDRSRWNLSAVEVTATCPRNSYISDHAAKCALRSRNYPEAST